MSQMRWRPLRSAVVWRPCAACGHEWPFPYADAPTSDHREWRCSVCCYADWSRMQRARREATGYYAKAVALCADELQRLTPDALWARAPKLVAVLHNAAAVFGYSEEAESGDTTGAGAGDLAGRESDAEQGPGAGGPGGHGV